RRRKRRGDSVRSIRRSLVVYFLLLMAAAFGAVGYLIDRQARRTLEDREKATLSSIDESHEKAKHIESEKFDADLANLATRVAYDVTIQKNKDDERFALQMQLNSVGGRLLIG